MPGGLTPSAGVAPAGSRWECPWLGVGGEVSDPAFVDLALRLGLASESWAGTLRRLPPRLPSRAASLRPGALAACAQSLWHNGVGMLPGCVLAAVSGIAWAVSAEPAWLGLAAAALLGMAGVLLHEAGHVVAFRLWGGRGLPAHLVARGFRCYLVRLELPSRRDRLVAAAGPIGPLVLGVPLTAALWGRPWLILWAAIVVGHLVMLLVPAGDGAALWRRARTGSGTVPNGPAYPQFRPGIGPCGKGGPSQEPSPTRATCGRMR